MIQQIKKSARSMVHFMRRCGMVCRFIITPPHWLNNPLESSYFPECEHKTKREIVFEHIRHILRYGEENKFYFLYGLDVKGRKFEQDDYLAYLPFMEYRNKFNYTAPYSYVCLLRNKELFAMVAEHYGYASTRNIGILHPTGMVEQTNKKESTILTILSQTAQLFCKPVDTECGAGIFCIGLRDGEYTWDDKYISKEELMQRIAKQRGDVLVQPRVIQHAEMDRLYPHAINTLRIVTLSNKDTVQHFATVLRIGTNGNIVDNWAMGGIAIMVKDDGTLNPYGYYKPSYGKRVAEHPNTQVQFSSFRVPYYPEAVEMCINFHRDLKYISAIGWDVAITEEGPILIEGNDNWEISIMQIDGGLKSKFYKFLN